MTFYPNLRDNVAGPLIKRFGQPGTYKDKSDGRFYNNATGVVHAGVTDTYPVYLLELRGKNRELRAQEFTEEVRANLSAIVLVDGVALAAAGVSPSVDETLTYGGLDYRILAIKALSPGGVEVLYTMAVQHV